jgi:hypothetical protein
MILTILVYPNARSFVIEVIYRCKLIVDLFFVLVKVLPPSRNVSLFRELTLLGIYQMGNTSDIVLNQQARVANGGGMADCLPGGPVAGKPMADTGRRSLWRIRRQAHGGLPCSTRI